MMFLYNKANKNSIRLLIALIVNMRIKDMGMEIIKVLNIHWIISNLII